MAVDFSDIGPFGIPEKVLQVKKDYTQALPELFWLFGSHCGVLLESFYWAFQVLALQATVWESRSATDRLCSSTGDFGCLKTDGKRESHPHPPPAPSLSFLGTDAFCCMDTQWGYDTEEIGYSGWTRESPYVVKMSKSRHIVAFISCIGKWKL